MKLAILGAAGKIGAHTVAEAIAAGHDAAAFARRPAGIPEPVGPGRLTRIAGDVLDQASLTPAIAGTDVVICTFGAPLNASTIRRVPNLCERATRNIINVMREQRVDRIVCMTAIGVGDSRDRGRWAFRRLIRPLILGRIFVDRDRQEQLIRASGLRWTIVRPAELTDEPAGPWRYVDPADRDAAEPVRVPRATVARALVHEAVTPQHLGRAPVLASNP